MRVLKLTTRSLSKNLGASDQDFAENTHSMVQMLDLSSKLCIHDFDHCSTNSLCYLVAPQNGQMIASNPSMWDRGGEDRESITRRDDMLNVSSVTVHRDVQVAAHDRDQRHVP